MLKNSLLLFFASLIYSCNDCDNPGESENEKLIFFSAEVQSKDEISLFVFDPETSFIDEINSNSEIYGFVDSELLLKRHTLGDGSDSLIKFNFYSDGTEQLIFEEIDGIEIINPSSHQDFQKVYFFGDNQSVYQSDFNNNLKLVSRDGVLNYGISISSIGNSGLIEKKMSVNQISIFNQNGDLLVSQILQEELWDDVSQMSWDESGNSLIFSLKSGENSSIYRTRVDGFTQKLFTLEGLRETSPFFINENIIGLLGSDGNLNFRNFSGDLVASINSSSGSRIVFTNFSESEGILITGELPSGEERLDISYYLIEVDSDKLTILPPNLLINGGIRGLIK